MVTCGHKYLISLHTNDQSKWNEHISWNGLPKKDISRFCKTRSKSYLRAMRPANAKYDSCQKNNEKRFVFVFYQDKK